MSSSWGQLSPDSSKRPTLPGHESDRSASSSQRRAADREAGAWSEDLEESIYGETDFSIPGMGDRPESCGRWYPESFCSDGHVNLGVSRCQNRDCPDCYGSYSRVRSTKVCRRLGAYRHAAAAPADKRTVHVAVSPPEGDVQTKEQWYRLLKDAYQLAKEKGVRGGVAVPHGYRVLDTVKRTFRAEDPDVGLWAWLRENETHWRDQTYWSPHVHIIGVARYHELGENSPEEDDGWVFKRLRTLKPFKIDEKSGYDDMIGTTRYILSHGTYEPAESKQMLRWFGELAPAGFSPEEALQADVLEDLEQRAEAIAGSGLDPEEDRDGAPAEEQCDWDGCEHDVAPIWEAGEALQNKNFCKSIGEERERELRAAFRWAIGEALPPPGLKNPRTKADAEEALQSLL